MLEHSTTMRTVGGSSLYMPYTGGIWVVCVLDLVELGDLAIELVAGVDAAARPLSGASANEHADPTPWLRGGELLMMDGLELRRSKKHIDAYVGRIAAAGVAALAIGIGDELPFARVPACWSTPVRMPGFLFSGCPVRRRSRSCPKRCTAGWRRSVSARRRCWWRPSAR